MARIEVDEEGLDRPLPFPADSARHAQSGPVALGDEFPIVLDVDEEDRPGAQVYVGNIWKVPSADNAYLAFLPLWYDGRNGTPTSDRVEVHLALSRDGVRSRRPSREPIITPGLEGSGSAGQIFPVPDPITVGDEVWLYYWGIEEDHMSEVQVEGNNQLARAIWQVDRFLALRPRGRGAGEVLTRPVRFEVRRLLVNVNTAAGGQCRVGIERPDGTPVPGHGLDDCSPLRANAISAAVAWSTDRDLAHLAGQTVRLRFELIACRLYAFEFANGK